MSFVLRSLSVLAYANGFTLWHYRSAEDPIAAVGRAGYFDAAADLLACGDMLLVSALDGGQVMAFATEGQTVTAQPLG